MKIAELSQDDANLLRNTLPADIQAGFRNAFDAEEGSRHVDGRRWALPSTERTYFIVSLDGTDYLLIGIKSSPPNAINISSFARVAHLPWWQGEVSPGEVCLRAFFEAKLVPMCRDACKPAAATESSKRAREIFENLKAKPPKGIKRILSRGEHWTFFYD